ncbi:MAG TPA: hypothetical protein VIJ14_02075 [Rhabdochlamydiaceae bacterium]
MTSALIGSTGYGLIVGGVSYVFCRAFHQHNAFEKAVLVTVLVGIRSLAEEAIKYQKNDKHQAQPLTRVLIASTYLLAIPCTLYAGRVFNFKAADYLQIVGLTSLGYTIARVLGDLYKMIPSNGSGEKR